jgi:hypothetical protein
MKCENCVYWNKDGTQSYGNRWITVRKGLGLPKEVQDWARPCRFMPKAVPKWRDGWCGQFKKGTDDNE